ncbi:hypothetical protein PGH26_14445 [Sporosarcina jeotgali]|uniref:Uncharacterized protein n=1 Tax=Sporosarcina jeotgali TaxID=3020056 RepID=A0ABZ0KUG8_9BACL|nr:hypothetical protein [Sporosarcina sp. B2O-1]WOV84051.1 hypothetical protein PGH26_14445 [Sporosarcina sp. B2O-1]
MYINTERSTVNYNKLNVNTMYHNTKESNGSKNSPMDKVEISNKNKISTNILSIDKGTAADTTLYVDRSTFERIAEYTTNNPDCRWSEIGVDSEKRWIVVNGQRFETPLSEEEKAAAKRSQMTLLDHLQEYEKHKEETLSKDKVVIDFTNKENPSSNKENPKIISLLQNDKVMEMLKNISKATKGKISISSSL